MYLLFSLLQILDYQLSPSLQKTNKDVLNKIEALNIPGFQHLSWFLPCHTELPELYYFLMALMLGQPAKTVPNEKKVSICFNTKIKTNDFGCIMFVYFI